MVAYTLLAACSDAPGEWTAIVYPDSADQSKRVATPKFQSLEMCRRAAKESIAALPDPAKASYACGYQCGSDASSPDLKACKEMKS
jgi:hypothetical protein